MIMLSLTSAHIVNVDLRVLLFSGTGVISYRRYTCARSSLVLRTLFV